MFPAKSKLFLSPTAALMLVVLALCFIGVEMIYSASAIYAEKNWGSQYYFLLRQIIWLMIGLVALRISSKLPYQKYQRLVPLLMMTSFVLLVLVLIPGIGKMAGNARRWIDLIYFSFQPSELLKFTLIVWVSSFLSRKREVLDSFSQAVMPAVLVMIFFFMLLLLQPDFGTSMLMGVIILLMIFVAGMRPSHLFVSFGGLAMIGTFLVLSNVYRMKRIIGFMDPWADPLNTGFQLIQSFIAFSTGGIFGKGLGNSQQKLFFLPEAHTDFILSIIAEETGLIGVAVIIALVLWLMQIGLKIALSCKDDFGRNLAFGITLLIVTQSFLNLGVAVGLLPTKGVPLPFISYGGSNLTINLLMVGVLLNIAKQNKVQ